MRRANNLTLAAAYKHLFRQSGGPRLFSAAVLPPHHVHSRVQLKVGGSGHVVLNVLKSKQTSEAAANDVLVVLPAGPALQASQPLPNVLYNTTRLVSRLSNDLPLTTIISLSYRLSSPKYQYPIPVHDVATGFTYIASPSSPHNVGLIPKISLLGSNIGGSLALMLALTSPHLVQSLAVFEPLVDWVGLDGRKSKEKDLSTKEALTRLIALRSRLFPSASAYFDPFASPLLFVRAAGRDTPSTHSSPLPENRDDIPAETSINADAFGPYDDDMTSAANDVSPKRRKVLRRWPASKILGESVLPYTRIVLREGGGMNSILRDQGTEMADCMRKSCFVGVGKGYGEERVKINISPEGELITDELSTYLW